MATRSMALTLAWANHDDETLLVANQQALEIKMAVTIPSNQALPIHLNPTLRGRRPSATLAINERCAQLVEQGQQIYRLGFGQSPFPVPQSVVAALREQAAQRSYLPVKGLAELRTAVAQFHQRYYGL